MRLRFFWMSVLSCLCASFLALPALAPAHAGAQASASLAWNLVPTLTDTAASDSMGVPERLPAWTMDELKAVLGRETGVRAAGGYREPKNGRVAMLCALLVPGLGQMYNERPFKAAIALGFETVYVSRILLNRRSMAKEERIRDTFQPNSYLWNYHDGWVAEYRERSIDWTWYSGAIILVLMIDAYVDAHLYDMRFKIGAASNGETVAAQIAFGF